MSRWLGGCYHNSGNLNFAPQPGTSSLEVPSSSAPEGAVWVMQTVCQTTKDACDFIFKPGFLEVAPGPELLIVHLVLGQRLCLNLLCQ